MRSVADTLASVIARMPKIGSETVALAAAAGRVLAKDIVAERMLPGFDNSAMDGYAARSALLPGTFAVTAVVAAGDAPGISSEVVRIYTGAPVPQGLDTVVMQEDTQRERDDRAVATSPVGENFRRAGQDIAAVGDRVTLPASPVGENIHHAGKDIAAVGDRVTLPGSPVGENFRRAGQDIAAVGDRVTLPASPVGENFRRAGQDIAAVGDRVTLPASPVGENIRRAGEDIAVGDRVLVAGTRLNAWQIGVLAALGVAHVEVARAPRVALLATGNELVDVASPLAPGQLVNSSAYALAALVAEAGGAPVSLGIVKDDLAAIRAALATPADVVITTGGVSAGDRDYVRDALDELELYKVAMKPGKPFSFGRVGMTPVFGLPGNPVSTLVGFELFVRPALLAMQGASVIDRPRRAVVLPAGYRKPAGRAHYLRARVTGDVAEVHAKQGSAMYSSVLATNALVEIAAELTELPPGGTAPAILLELV